VTDAPGARTPEPDGPAPLRTEPRPLVVHWLVDSAVLFLATIIVALFVGVSWWVVLVFSLVLGGGAARLTYQADVRATAERRAG